MIYFKTTDAKHIIVLEPGNLVDMKAGELIRSPNGEVAIVYTPDLPWFQERLVEMLETDRIEFDPEKFDKIHQESMHRPERIFRPNHGMTRII